MTVNAYNLILGMYIIISLEYLLIIMHYITQDIMHYGQHYNAQCFRIIIVK